MDFWNDNIMFVKPKNEKCGLKKKCQSSVKIKMKNKHHQMKNLLMKCIETFLIYVFLILIF
jgi:hypothetical protein